ncbi:MAG: beta-3-deoxy-D-manno-oct-2-ulosonic acid transferase [Betaproteobacteria bacterium]|nr:beta-3-deoxy-D-manno-oct-2-ulosonic acid transferase [Betaproteobacteria bacterium]
MEVGRFAALPAELCIYAFPRWKWPVVRQCFVGHTLYFIQAGAPVPPAGGVVLWGRAPLPSGVQEGRVVLRMEDGFLRSVGLGAELVRPMSWVVDTRGMYYDTTQPSDLEVILAGQDFSTSLVARAQALRQRIVQAGLTKYNLGAQPWARPAHARRVILVPGQVESDASIAFGATDLQHNMALLRAVRKANPEAYVLYKSHPDVVARLRKLGQDEGHAQRWCDEVVAGVGMETLLDAVDEVHVLTSLAGFEALLRGKAVTCYGQPFYAGWGLTHDIVPHLRRTRRLQLDELVAGVLLLYPLYLSRANKRLVTPEQALDELLAWKARVAGKTPWWQEIYRFFLRRFIGVR